MLDFYSREEALKLKLNSFLSKSFGLPERDYYARMGPEKFLGLKSALSEINYVLTLKVTLAFVHWMAERFGFNQQYLTGIVNDVLVTKPNANGYDVEVSSPLKFVAEVKCNIPINGSVRYGSAQKNRIQKDLDGLINGKVKSGIDPSQHIKFMVFLDLPEIRDATSHFVSNMKEGRSRVCVVNDETKIEASSVVYIVYVSFD